jgi:hypothetical protein
LSKLAGWQGTLLELVLPIAFASLLLLLKNVATIYEAPNVAYSCGPARPFDASVPVVGDLGWVGCLQQPLECTEDGYYQNPYTIPLLGEFFGSLGYVNFLAFPVANSDPYTEIEPLGLPFPAPSLPITDLMARMLANGVVLGIAPETSALVTEVAAFEAWLALEVPDSVAAIKVFGSEAELEAYMLDPQYDSCPGPLGAFKRP